MILIRIALIGLIVYLLVRSFIRYSGQEASSTQSPGPVKNNPTDKKVSKKIGEYVDYEEIDRKNS